MLKSVTKLILMFVGTAALALAAASASYIITKSSVENRLREEQNRTSVSADTNQAGIIPNEEAEAKSGARFDCYIVRLAGENLSVYASHGGNEEFLYNESIYTNDLTAEDRELLNTGVMLESSEALTGFIENFTS